MVLTLATSSAGQWTYNSITNNFCELKSKTSASWTEMYRELLSQNSLLNVKKQEYYENEQVSEEGKYKFAEDNKTCEEFLHAWGITIFKI